MFVIAKDFTFSASHQLSHLPPPHPCARLHGHNYTVQVQVTADGLDADGFVLDYGELSRFREYVDQVLDHHHLNDVLGSSVATTAERLALHLAGVFATLYPVEDFPYLSLVAVRVSETPKTWAEYRL